MMLISDYVKIILKKNKISKTELLKRINELEIKVEGEIRTRKQNLTNYLNDFHSWGYEFTRKVEVALGLNDGFLVNMLGKPTTKLAKQRYKEIMDKYKVKEG